MMTRLLLLLLTMFVLAACGGDDGGGATDTGPSSTSTEPTAPTGSDAPPELALPEVGRFDEPVLALGVPGTDQVAVVEKGGRIIVVDGMACVAADQCPEEPVTTGTTVLDITDEVSDGSEQGLLGLAFHPDWPDDPRIFINYTDRQGDTHIETMRLVGSTAASTGRKELLSIEQPYPNHNGGDLAFGPDGFLYIGTGDGGSGGDPEDRAQRTDELLGKMLRIDVDAGGERGYAIPDGNLDDGRDEVWAVGLRNPWRFSFDAKTGDLWIGDVGQDAFEEIDAVTADSLAPGADTPNFGWRRSEGFEEFDDSGETGPGTIVGPVLDYGRDDGCSVTGGIVYRGKLVPDLDGWYLFADFCGDDLRLLQAEGVPGSARERGDLEYVSRPGVPQVASFGLTADGELLVVSLGGSIHQVVGA